MKSLQLTILVLTGLLPGTSLMGQTWVAGQHVTLNVNNYSLIATNNAAVSLTLTTSTAGAAVSSATNNSMYVKISSIVPGNSRREITAEITNGFVPFGTRVTLVSAACTTANSGGTRGNPVSNPITLSYSDQNLVTGIGSCWTGTGNNDGYRMTFTWATNNPSNNYQWLSSDTYNITVVFTLTAHD